MEEKSLAAKDPAWNQQVISVFRERQYEKSLERSLAYEWSARTGKTPIVLNNKDWAIVYYTIISSASGILKARQDRDDATWNLFFRYFAKYVEKCAAASRENEIKGMHTDQPKAILKDALELLCRFESRDLEGAVRRCLNAFLAIESPGWGLELTHSVLREKLFDERMRFERSNYVENTRVMAKLYLELTEASDQIRHGDFRAGRAQVMNLLSDLAYFQGGEAGELEALGWAERCLQIHPEDRFAKAQKRFIEERRTVTEQIRRFEHDTGHAIAGIIATLELLMKEPEAARPEFRQSLQTIRVELTRIQGVNRFISDKEPAFDDVDPIPAIQELVGAFRAEADIRIQTESEPVKWDTDIDYLCLAIYNLLKNAIEAFDRNHIPHEVRRVILRVNHEHRRIRVQDNAGGIPSDYRSRIFEPYVSSKGIQQKTGLGLSQARIAIEDKLEGRLILSEPQPPDGAAFEIHL